MTSSNKSFTSPELVDLELLFSSTPYYEDKKSAPIEANPSRLSGALGSKRKQPRSWFKALPPPHSPKSLEREARDKTVQQSCRTEIMQRIREGARARLLKRGINVEGLPKLPPPKSSRQSKKGTKLYNSIHLQPTTKRKRGNTTRSKSLVATSLHLIPQSSSSSLLSLSTMEAIASPPLTFSFSSSNPPLTGLDDWAEFFTGPVAEQFGNLVSPPFTSIASNPAQSKKQMTPIISSPIKLDPFPDSLGYVDPCGMSADPSNLYELFDFFEDSKIVADPLMLDFFN